MGDDVPKESTTSEIFKIKDHLISVERKVGFVNVVCNLC